MGRTEEEHAVGLVLAMLKSFKKGERLKVMFDVDDTSANSSDAVLTYMGINPKQRGKKFYHKEILGDDAKPDKYITAYYHVWREKPTAIKAQLSYESAKKLSESTDFSFISAREKATGLSRWVGHNYPGLSIPIVFVSPLPYNLHGFRKLQQDVHVLVDDSPAVAASMINGYAKGRSLLLVDRWEEAVEKRNSANTAVVADAESAARCIFKALEVHAGGVGQKHAMRQVK